ncbi:MAG TPA: DUF4783 domain-containing protein [Daejeonella sp.]|nr:DUF4783 domain-containing protein [Daejeonella sp.]
MKAPVIISFLLCTLLVFPVKATKKDIVDDLTSYLKSSNTREISKHFASTVELIILNEEDVYSKVQAEIILKDFLYKHKPVDARVVHRLDSNPNYRFTVIELDTENGNFRTSISLKDTGGKFLITEMRIEFDKE